MSAVQCNRSNVRHSYCETYGFECKRIYGGDEFVVVLSNTALPRTRWNAIRMRDYNQIRASGEGV